MPLVPSARRIPACVHRMRSDDVPCCNLPFSFPRFQRSGLRRQGRGAAYSRYFSLGDAFEWKGGRTLFRSMSRYVSAGPAGISLTGDLRQGASVMRIICICKVRLMQSRKARREAGARCRKRRRAAQSSEWAALRQGNTAGGRTEDARPYTSLARDLLGGSVRRSGSGCTRRGGRGPRTRALASAHMRACLALLAFLAE